MNRIVFTVDLDSLFHKELGSDIDPDIFTDQDGRQDPMYYSLVLDIAIRYVDNLTTAGMCWYLDRITCDFLAFQYYAELSKETVRHALYVDESQKALYWTVVSNVLALMFRYVQQQREIAAA